jgi:hypothetical protein
VRSRDSSRELPLPAVFFVAFLTISFDPRYLGIFVFMPILLFALLGWGTESSVF